MTIMVCGESGLGKTTFIRETSIRPVPRHISAGVINGHISAAVHKRIWHANRP